MNNAASGSRVETLDQVTSLVNMLGYRASETPNQEACYFEGESMTFGRLWDSLNRVAGFLNQLGVDFQDRVVLVMPNGLEFFPAFYGVQRTGAIAVPLFPGSGPQRILKIIQH